MADNIEVIELLAQAENEAEFLEKLAAIYRQMSIGPGLDFADVQRYWRGEAQLPHAWRQALARCVCRDQQSINHYFLRDSAAHFHAWALAARPLEDWLAYYERVVVLFSPFVTADKLASNWLPQASHASVRMRDWESALAASILTWAQAMAQGEKDWSGLQAWVMSAGANPACLASALSKMERLDEQVLLPLIQLYLFMIALREQLQLDQEEFDQAIEVLAAYASHFNLRLSISLDCDEGPYVAQQFSLAFLQRLATSPCLAGVLQRYEGANLCQRLDLMLLLAESPERFGELLEYFPRDAIGNLSTSRRFCERYPAEELLLRQLKFESLGWLNVTFLETPEALAWYRQVIEKLPVHSSRFQDTTEVLARHLDEAELHGLVSRLIAPNLDALPGWRLLDQVNDTDRLYSYLGACNPALASMAASRLMKLAAVPRSPEDDDQPVAWALLPEHWPLLQAASRTYPSLFIKHLNARDLWRGCDSLERWRLLWTVAQNAQQRIDILKACLIYGGIYGGLGSASEHAGLLGFVERLYDESPEDFRQLVSEESSDCLERMTLAMGRPGTPLLALVPLMAGRFLTLSSRPPLAIVQAVRRALVAHPAVFAGLDEKAQIKLLPLFDDACLEACAESLALVFASGSKTLRAPAVALIARCSAQALQRSGLLEAEPKARKPVLIGMALSAMAGMAELVARHIADQAHDDYSRSISLDALERAGLPLQGLDPWAGLELADLQRLAQTQKASATAGKSWNDEFANLLAPLGEPLGQFLLSILAEGGEVLPRRARQILAFLPAGRRSDLAFLGVEQWIGTDGAAAFDWLLLLLPDYGDERAANALVKAVKDWKATRKPKASAAIRLLCRLPGNYGVAQARELWESGKFSESIMANARLALSEAAERQGLSLAAFLEQLVPDFGLRREGLKLDVGPYSYTVRIRPDLSLVVLDEKGKSSKSLPKAKIGEDPDKRSLAENQFKALAKNLKPVLKQQGKRLTRALQLGSRWPVPIWRRWFAEHPLLASIAQAVVWAAEDSEGQALGRFRPDENGALIDLQDEDFVLADDALVHIVHPLELDEHERAAWAQHFADYALVSPIGQWEFAVHRPIAEELQANVLTRAKGSRLPRGKFGSLLEKWGYIKGDAGGETRFDEHSWSLDGEHWLVTLEHSGISVFFDPDEVVDIEGLTVCKRAEDGYARQRLGDLPPALLNTLLDQAEQLRAVAEA